MMRVFVGFLILIATGTVEASFVGCLRVDSCDGNFSAVGYISDFSYSKEVANATIYYDGSGCNPPPSNRTKPWVSLVDRGGCEFVTKVSNAEKSDANAVIVINYDDSYIAMDGYSKNPLIPSLLVDRDDGEYIKQHLDANYTISPVRCMNIYDYYMSFLLPVLMCFLIALSCCAFSYNSRRNRYYRRNVSIDRILVSIERSVDASYSIQNDADDDSTSSSEKDPLLETPKCVICMSGIKNDPIQLECDHLFHRKCIRDWFHRQMNCPTCKRDYTNHAVAPEEKV